MNLTTELLIDIREFNVTTLAKQCLKIRTLKKLVHLALNPDELISSRAMWVIAHCDESERGCMKAYYSTLILNLQQPNLPAGVKRHTLRLFQNNKVPQKHESLMIDICYRYLKNPSEAIAIRSFAITVIYNISKPYPELLNELKLLLYDIKETDTAPGIVSKVKNTLKLIEK